MISTDRFRAEKLVLLLTACTVVVSAACRDAARPGAKDAASPTASKLEEAPDQSLGRNGVRINYRSIGVGEPIVLLHGYGDNLRMWDALADSLAAGYRVIALDARGFGKSGKPAGVENYGQAMLDDVIALLDSTGIGQSHIVGYSMGAMMAAKLALAHPERVRTVTLAAGSFQRDPAALRGMIAPWVDDMEHGRRLTRLLKEVVPALSDSLAKAYSDQLFSEGDSAALVGAMKGFKDFALDWSKVASSKVPVVAIVGLGDPLLPFSRDIARSWPGAKLVELADTDHMTIPASPRLLEEIRLLVSANPVSPASR